MKKLIEVVQDAGRKCVAIGHFNVADLVLLKGIFEAARELNLPVIVGASEGEREFAGTRQLAALVGSLREEFDFPIFLNADHTHSLKSGMEAVKSASIRLCSICPRCHWKKMPGQPGRLLRRSNR